MVMRPLALSPIPIADEALKADIGAVDEPLILATNTFLAVEADPLKAATDELIIWSVVVSEELNAIISLANKPLAFDADPLRAADDELIIWSVVCKLLLKAVYPVVDVMSTCTEPDTVPDGKLPVIASASGTLKVIPSPRNI